MDVQTAAHQTVFCHPQSHLNSLYMYTLLTYLLTPWSRVLLEKLTGLQLVKKFPAFCGTRKFITALTSARHLSLSWASSIQSTHPHPTSRRSILILPSHLRLGLPSGLLPSGFPTKTLYVQKCFVIIGLLKHVFRFTASLIIKKMASMLIFNAGCCTS